MTAKSCLKCSFCLLEKGTLYRGMIHCRWPNISETHWQVFSSTYCLDGHFFFLQTQLQSSSLHCKFGSSQWRIVLQTQLQVFGSNCREKESHCHSVNYKVYLIKRNMIEFKYLQQWLSHDTLAQVFNLPENFLLVDSPLHILDFVVNIHTGIDLGWSTVSWDKSRQFENIDKHNWGVHPPALMLLYMNLKVNGQHVTKKRITRQNWKSC